MAINNRVGVNYNTIQYNTYNFCFHIFGADITIILAIQIGRGTCLRMR